MMAMLVHISAFAGFAVPFGNVVAPLVIWVLKKDEMPLVDDQGKEVINFQITVMLAFLASGILCLLVIGFCFLMAVPVLNLIFTIVGAVKAYDGVRYRYPWCIRFIR